MVVELVVTTGSSMRLVAPSRPTQQMAGAKGRAGKADVLPSIQFVLQQHLYSQPFIDRCVLDSIYMELLDYLRMRSSMVGTRSGRCSVSHSNEFTLYYIMKILILGLHLQHLPGLLHLRHPPHPPWVR